MTGYRHIVDGKMHVPMPDDAAARAKAFAEVASAWSTMLSSIEHLLHGTNQQPLLTPGTEWRPSSWSSPPPTIVPQAKAADIIPEPPTKPNGKHKGRPLGSFDKKKRRKRGRASS